MRRLACIRFYFALAIQRRGGCGGASLAELQRGAIRSILPDMDAKLEEKLKAAVHAAGKRAIARGITNAFEAIRFAGEQLLDSRDPDVQAALQWLVRQHRRDLN